MFGGRIIRFWNFTLVLQVAGVSGTGLRLEANHLSLKRCIGNRPFIAPVKHHFHFSRLPRDQKRARPFLSCSKYAKAPPL